MAMENPCNDVDMGSTDEAERAVTRSITLFLRSWLLKYFPSPKTETGFHGTNAAKAIGLSQGYISQIGRRIPEKAPGIGAVIKIRDVSGASWEEITGHRAPLDPRYPFSVIPYGFELAVSAADDALSRVQENPPMRGNHSRAAMRPKPLSTPPIPAEPAAPPRPRSPTLLRLVETHPMRWSAGAIAAAMTLPADARSDTDAWAKLLDRLDSTFRKIVML